MLSLLAELLPAPCGGCGRTGEGSPCGRCLRAFRPAPRLVAPEPLATLRALVAYEAPASRFVVGLKRRHDRAGTGWCADGLALLLPDADLVTWAPTSRARARRRGGDHARALAEAAARTAGIRAHVTLDRLPGPPQHGRSRLERLAGPAFVPRFQVEGLRVAVIDDVTTTGATLAAAARALVAAGAAVVHGVVVASAPDVPTGPKGPVPGD